MFRKLVLVCSLTILTGCYELVAPLRPQEFLIIIESNTSWAGYIDNTYVSGTASSSPKWYVVNRPGVCWRITKLEDLGMLRAYATTPDFEYGYLLGYFKMWGDQNTTSPNGVIRGCIPEDATY
jgi:hypothetical protein